MTLTSLTTPWAGDRGISRFSHMEVPYVHRFSDHAGSTSDSR
jgi:hypothetical protein